MSRISRRYEKSDNGNELLGDYTDEGSAARTRPFTFEEIMLRRKSNKLSAEAKEVAGDPDKLSGKDNAKNVSNHSEHDPVLGDVMNHASEDTVKTSSTEKQETTSPKEDSVIRGKGKESSDAEANIIEKSDKDMKNRDRNEKRSHHRSRNEERSKDDFENESKKKHSQNSMRKEKYVDTERRKSESESKRKQQTRDEEKNRFEDGNVVKKHDSGKRYDLEPEGRKSRKKEPSQSQYEEVRPKTRRSRSREKRGRDRRSISLSPRAHKRSSYHGREHGESSYHSFKDRKHSDVDWKHSDVDRKHSDVDRRHSDVDRKHSDVDRKHNSDVDRRHSDVDKKHSDVDKRHSDVDGKHSDVDRKHSDVDRKHSDVDRKHSDVDRKHSDVDRRHSDVDRRHSDVDRKHSDVDRKHSEVDRRHSDVDRNRTSNNGGYGNSHYQRHGGRGSRLGGYSPRKRRTEAAVKTPSPTPRSPERKSAGWDLPPAGNNIASVGSMLSNFQTSRQIESSTVNELPATVFAASNAGKALSGASPNRSPVSNKISMDSIQLAQATRPMRRLCVENVPTSASDKSIMDCFNNFFLSLEAYHVQGTPPCISCIMTKEKGQALVEFITPEDATTALSFDGRSFSGSILKVRRPKDFVESATGVAEKPVAVVDAVSDVIKDSPYKIFVGGISKVLSSDMVMEIASAFGALRGYRFQINEDGSGACAFLEYVDKSITLKACAGLNGMKLGGQVLTVIQATPDAPIEDEAVEPHYGVPEHAKTLLSKPTKVLKLKNVLNQDELLTVSGPEVEELLEDIRLECARYGTVKSVNIVRNGSSSATAPGEITNQADLRSSTQHAEDENNIKEKELTEKEVDPNSVETGRPEASNDVRETLGEGGDAENNRPSHDEHEEDKLNTDIPTSHLDTETNPQSSPSQLDTTKVESGQKDNNKDDFALRNNSSVEGSSMVEEELKKTDEGNTELQEASVKLDDTSTRNSDSNQNGETKQQVDVFEDGCVLVEYARAEASCAAAHCLHGRLFGDRIVAVDYVDHDLYMSRFPK